VKKMSKDLAKALASQKTDAQTLTEMFEGERAVKTTKEIKDALRIWNAIVKQNS